MQSRIMERNRTNNKNQMLFISNQSSFTKLGTFRSIWFSCSIFGKTEIGLELNPEHRNISQIILRWITGIWLDLV